LLDDEALRRRMGEAARRRALAEQTSRRRAEQYDRFLRELVRPVAERRQTEPVATM
jgi:glycosyltransferase involved in cell wall biosynthesis